MIGQPLAGNGERVIFFSRQKFQGIDLGVNGKRKAFKWREQ